MFGIRFHGRGGQGAVLASKILASAYFSQGFFVQSFPFFGMERKGAAVAAFVRVATTPIVERGEIQSPSKVVVLDATLLQMVDVTKGVCPDGIILLEHSGQDDRRPLEGPLRIAAVDARSIALEYGLGTKIAPIVNTVMLGAFAKISENLDLENLIAAIKASVPINPEQNASAARAAFSAVRWLEGKSVPLVSPVQATKAIQCSAQLSVLPETSGSIDWNPTGTWRYLTPVAVNKLPPCRSRCPAGLPIPEILHALSQDQGLKAWQMLMSANPLPGITGRLCYHPCQTDCLRRKIDQPVAIQLIERFIAAQSFSPSFEITSDKSARVALVGTGPVGLTCAYFLGRSGYRVVAMAVGSRPGGPLLGLSQKKLETKILESEVARLIKLSNVELRLGVSIDRYLMKALKSEFDLIIVDPSDFEYSGSVENATLDLLRNEAGNSRINAILSNLPKELKPFKYSLIAHHVAIGRRIAQEAHSYLSGQNRPGPGVQLVDDPKNATDSLTPLRLADIGLERFATTHSPLIKSAAKSTVIENGQALLEASRCLSCGTCNLCRECIASCPDVSIHPDRDTTGVIFDLYHCKGCGICAYECPRGVISMENIKL